MLKLAGSSKAHEMTPLFTSQTSSPKSLQNRSIHRSQQCTEYIHIYHLYTDSEQTSSTIQEAVERACPADSSCNADVLFNIWWLPARGLYEGLELCAQYHCDYFIDCYLRPCSHYHGFYLKIGYYLGT